MADTIKNSYVPFNGDGTAERIDQSLQDDLDLEWYRREKLAPKGDSIPVIYGTVTVDGIDVFYKKYLYSKKRGNRWRGKWKELKEQVIAAQVFCYGGTYSIDEITYPNGVGSGNKYDGTQTTPPSIIYSNRSSSKWGNYGWDATSIGKGLVYAEYYGDNARGHFSNESIVATITRTDVANNHADVLVDYLTNTDYGVGWDASLLDLPSFNAAKTYLTTTDPTSGKAFLNCHFALDTSQSFKKNLETLLGECRGALIESNGKIKLIIEQAINPLIVIDESNIVGKLQTESLDSAKRFNRVIAKYFDESGKAASMVVYPQTKAEHDEYLKEDNGVINQGELSLKTITDADQALTQARIMCELSRGGEALTVTVHGEATLLEVFDVVEVHYPDLDLIPVPDGSGGLKLPEYIVEEVQPDLEKQTAKIKLRFYNSSIYPLQAGRTEPPSPPRVPPISDVGTITFTEVQAKENNKLFIRWDYEGDYAPTYNVGIYRGTIAEANLEYITSTELEQITTPPLKGGNYILELVMRDRLGVELLSSTFTFSTDFPNAPVSLITTADYSSITIEPTLASGTDDSNTDFVYYLGVTSVEANAKNYGSGDIKQVTGLKPDTTHHIWVYTKTPFGVSSTAAYTTQKTEKIPSEVGGTRFEQRFKLAPPTSKPATPTGDKPTGWFTHPLPQSGNDVNWTSTAEKNPDGTLATGASWSEPVLFDAIGQYTWTAYADDPLGNGISLNPSGKKWIGQAYNQIEETPDISNPSVYEWSIYRATHPETRYKESASKPARPTVSFPSGWSYAPPPAPTTKVWVSTAQKELDGSLVGNWSEPEEFTLSEDGDTIYFEYQYSVNGSLGWHSDFSTGDKYRRQRKVTNGVGGAWSSAARISGYDGTNGSDGIDGTDGKDGAFQSYIFRTAPAASRPSTPTGGSYNGSSESVPSGWRDDPYYTNGHVTWVSHRTYRDTGSGWTGTAWSTPSEFSIKGDNGSNGSDGADGSDGTGWYTFAGNGGVFPSNAQANSDFRTLVHRSPLNGDHFIYVDRYNNTTKAETRRYNGSSWVDPSIKFNGDVIVDGTIRAGALDADSVIAGNLGVGAINAANIFATGVIEADALNSTALDLRGSNVSIKMASGSSSTPVFQVNTNGHMITRSANIEGEVSIGKNPSASNYYKLYGQSTAGSASTAMRIRENNVNTFELMYDGQVVSRNSSGTVMMNLDPASGQFVFNGDVRADKVIGSKILRGSGSFEVGGRYGNVNNGSLNYPRSVRGVDTGVSAPSWGSSSATYVVEASTSGSITSNSGVPVGQRQWGVIVKDTYIVTRWSGGATVHFDWDLVVRYSRSCYNDPAPAVNTKINWKLWELI